MSKCLCMKPLRGERAARKVMEMSDRSQVLEIVIYERKEDSQHTSILESTGIIVAKAYVGESDGG